MKESSACGKFIIAGEHSIVHKGSALAAPLRALNLSYKEEKAHTSSIQINNVDKSAEFLSKFQKLWKHLEISEPVGALQIHSTIPMGRGLGSSAALCTAIIEAHYPDLEASQKIKKIHHAENFFHGKSSGLDPHVVALNKCLEFQKDLTWKEVSSENFNQSPYSFFLIDSGREHDTKEVIESVTIQKERNRDAWNTCLNRLVELSFDCKNVFENEPEELAPLLNQIHENLNFLGASDLKLEALRSQLLESGFEAVKITGAGKGGCLLGWAKSSKIQNLDKKILCEVSCI